jgi:hypothetical protein
MKKEKKVEPKKLKEEKPKKSAVMMKKGAKKDCSY